MMKEFVEMRDVRKIYRMGEVEIAQQMELIFR
mgnify:CR=1 FL=1